MPANTAGGISMVVQGQDKVGRLLGINGVWGNMGIAAAAFVAAALGDWISWGAAFYLPGAIAVATGLVYLWVSRSWPVEDKIAEAKKQNIGAAIALSPAARTAMWRVIVILGMAALFAPVVVNRGAVLRDSLSLAAASLLLTLFVAMGEITRWQGGLMFVLLAALIVYSYWSERRRATPSTRSRHRLRLSASATLPVRTRMQRSVSVTEWSMSTSATMPRSRCFIGSPGPEIS